MNQDNKKQSDLIKNLYHNVINSGKYKEDEFNGGFDYFKTGLQDEKSRKYFYDNMLSRGFTANDVGKWDSFNDRLNNYFKSDTLTSAQLHDNRNVLVNNVKG